MYAYSICHTARKVYAKYRSLACGAALLNLAMAPLAAAEETPQQMPYQPALGENCSYTLAPAAKSDPNVITTYSYMVNSNGELTMTPLHYQLNMRRTSFGEATAENVRTFYWAISDAGEWSLMMIGDYDPEDWQGIPVVEFRYEDGATINERIEVAYGGSHTGNISGDYIGVVFEGRGTVLSNSGTFDGSVSGNFIGNHATSDGGVIYNNNKQGSIDTITGSFIGNSAGTDGYRQVFGGAIYNIGTINSVTGDFIGNYVAKGVGIAYGGAIYNSGMIGELTGDFIGNSLSSDISVMNQTSGGAIYSSDTGVIKKITGSFIGNSVVGHETFAMGGAIYNSATSANFGTIEEIVGDFIDNHTNGSGGAIYNNAYTSRSPYVYGAIGTITGNFIGNYVDGGTQSASCQPIGGAIYNKGEITKIAGDFIANYVKGVIAAAGGGAFYNGYNIGEITGSFVGNHAENQSERGLGGAIYNGGTIGTITGDFIGNYAASVSANAMGGAIYNVGAIESINGSITNNRATTETGTAMGGAIYTTAPVNITADGKRIAIQGNYITDKDHAEKHYQAIYFNNTTTTNGRLSLTAQNGGEIYMDDLVEGSATGYEVIVSGDNTSKVTFNRELLQATEFSATGVMLGLGVSNGTATDHTSKAAAAGTKGYDYESRILTDVAGAITINNGAKLDTLDGRATNYTLNQLAIEATYALDIIADEEGTYDLTITKDGVTETVKAVKSDRITVKEGSSGSLTITAFAFGGSASGGDIYARILDYAGEDDSIQLALGDIDSLSELSVEMNSRSVLVETIELLTSKTKNDTIHLTLGDTDDMLSGWAKLEAKDEEQKVFTVLEGDTVAPTSDINNEGTLEGKNITIQGANMNSSVLNMGDKKFLDTITADQEIALRNITVNKDKSIVNKGKLTLESLNLNAGITNENEVTVKGAWTISSDITGQGKVTFDDAVTTVTGTVRGQEITHSGNSETHLVASSDGSFKNFEGSKLDMKSGDLYLHAAAEAVQAFSLPRVAAANMVYGAVSLGGGTLSLEKLTIGDGNIYVGSLDVNLAAETIGHISAKEYEYVAGSKGHIYVDSLTYSNGGSSKNEIRLNFVDGAIAAAVVPFKNEVQTEKPTDGSEWVSNTYMVWSPVLEWAVTYSYDTGDYIFSRDVEEPGNSGGNHGGQGDKDKSEETGKPGLPEDPDKPVQGGGVPELPQPGSGSNSGSSNKPDTPGVPDSSGGTGTNRPGVSGGSGAGNGSSGPRPGVNPAALASSAAQHSAFAAMAQMFSMSFGHADMYSSYLIHARRVNDEPEAKRVATSDYFGRTSRAATYLSASKPREAGKASLPGFKGGMWLSTYSSFEKLPVDNAPKTDVTMYGAVVSGATDMETYSNGWASVFSMHAAYMGSKQKFSRTNASGVSSVSTNQNGGCAGATMTLYKGGFYTALTGSIGAANAHSATMYGTENFRMFLAGVASRSGYSFALGESGFIMQPSLQISYTRVAANDYYSAADVHMDSAPMHVIQLNPALKLIKHTESGWDPYLSAGYVHNFMGKTRVIADGYKLPELSVDPYGEYTLGVQKTWSNTYTFYGQVTGRSGGREGVEVNAGFRYAW